MQRAEIRIQITKFDFAIKIDFDVFFFGFGDYQYHANTARSVQIHFRLHKKKANSG